MNKQINKVKSLASNLFFGKEDKNIFGHKANGDHCCVCKKEMHTKQGITRVGSGEKMHSDCWGDFFNSRIANISRDFKQ